MAIHVTGTLITSDQTNHSARSVGQTRWVVSYLPGRTVGIEQAVAALRIAEVVDELTALTRLLALTPCEAIGQAMLQPRPATSRTPTWKRRSAISGAAVNQEQLR